MFFNGQQHIKRPSWQEVVVYGFIANQIRPFVLYLKIKKIKKYIVKWRDNFTVPNT